MKRTYLVTILIILSISSILVLDLNHEKDSSCTSSFQLKFPEDVETKSLAEVRQYYHILLKRIDVQIKHLEEDGINTTGRAICCAELRSQARRVARESNPSLKNRFLSIVLQARDSYQYGLRNILSAISQDVKEISERQQISFLNTRLSIQSMINCMLPSNKRACPTYSFLRSVHQKGDDDILASCMKKNKWYDNLAKQGE